MGFPLLGFAGPAVKVMAVIVRGRMEAPAKVV
jgi:hypothetical protein